MAHSIGDLYVRIGAKTADLEKSLNKVESKLKGFSSKMDKILLGVAAAMGAVGTAGIKLGMSMEQNRMAFTKMLGSAEKAGAFLKELGKFAASTPFELPDVVDGAKKLMALGFEAEKVVPTLTAIGDAAAAIGGGADTIQGVIIALGQMRLKGKVSSEELNQLAERNIPAYEILKEKLNLTADQMENIGKAGLDANVAVDALVQGMNEKFGGMMVEQSKTLGGLWSTALDSVKMKIMDLAGVATDGSIISGGAFERIKEKVAEFLKTLDRLQADGTLDRWSQQIRDGVGKAFDKIQQLYDFVSKHKDEIIKFVEGFVGAWAFSKTVTGISNIVTAVTNLKTAIDTLGKSQLAMAILSRAGVIGASAALAYSEAKKFNEGDWNSTTDVWGNSKKSKASQLGMGAPGTGNLGSLFAAPPVGEREIFGPPGKPAGWGQKSKTNTSPAQDIRTVSDVLAEMNAELAVASNMEALLGNEFDQNSARSKALSSAIEELAGMKLPLNDARLKDLVARYQIVSKEMAIASQSTTTVSDVLKTMNQELAIAADWESLLGDKYNQNEARAAALKDAIQQLLELGLKPTDDTVKNLIKRYNVVAQEMEIAEEATKKLQKAQEDAKKTAEALAATHSRSLDIGLQAFQKIYDATYGPLSENEKLAIQLEQQGLADSSMSGVFGNMASALRDIDTWEQQATDATYDFADAQDIAADSIETMTDATEGLTDAMQEMQRIQELFDRSAALKGNAGADKLSEYEKLARELETAASGVGDHNLAWDMQAEARSLRDAEFGTLKFEFDTLADSAAGASKELEKVSESLRNTPVGVKVNSLRWASAAPEGVAGVAAGGVTVTGSIYGFDDFKQKVGQAFGQLKRANKLGMYGTTAGAGVY